MNESFLHYIWQFQYFDKQVLTTVEGDVIEIFKVGFYNTHAGPDFFNARVNIADVMWVGNIEIHINSSDWDQHHHSTDKGYENVILHVVWNYDKVILRNDGSSIPTIELKNRVDKSLIYQYRKFIHAPESIPCASAMSSIASVTKLSMMEKSLMQRLERKASLVDEILNKNLNDWEETCYQMLAKNFGFKVNAGPFERLARLVPYKLLMKHSSNKLQIEAMLFGQAGFLEDDDLSDDQYFYLLKREYQLLAAKFSLHDTKLHESQWKFLRLRPANFPTLRLSQFASLMFERKNLFSSLIEASSYKKLKKIFAVPDSIYWQTHYQFGKISPQRPATFGDISIDNIIINTVIPLWVAYGKSRDDQHYVDKAISVLQEIKAESNNIISKWKTLPMQCANAFDSQALLELYNAFCLKRRCLDCSIGTSLIRPAK